MKTDRASHWYWPRKIMRNQVGHCAQITALHRSGLPMWFVCEYALNPSTLGATVLQVVKWLPSGSGKMPSAEPVAFDRKSDVRLP